MGLDANDAWLKLPAFVLSIFSLLGSTYVCISAYMLRRLRKQTRRQSAKGLVITHCVFYMSLCDMMINIWILLVWTPPIFGKTRFYPLPLCRVIGAFGQFALVASSCFYNIIALITWTMVTAIYKILMKDQQSMSVFSSIPLYSKKTSSSLINSQSNLGIPLMINNDEHSAEHAKNALINTVHKVALRGGIFAICISMVLTAIPFLDNSYGYVNNVSSSVHDEFECWITGHYYQLCLYIPITLYILFALILTLYSVCKIRQIAQVKANADFNQTKKALLIRRLWSFTAIFVCTWIFPLTVRVWPLLITDKDPPFWLLVLHHASLGCIGLGNSIVWITSSSFQSCNKSIKVIRATRAQSVASQRHNAKNKPLNRVKRFLTNADDDPFSEYILNASLASTTKKSSRAVSSVHNLENNYPPHNRFSDGYNVETEKSTTYKLQLDPAAVHKLNRHKKSFKRDAQNAQQDRKHKKRNANQDEEDHVQMSKVSSASTYSARNTRLSTRTTTTDIFDDDDEFSIDESMSKYSVGGVDDEIL